MRRYVAKAEPGKGWRIFESKMQRWWGNYFSMYPEELLEELNGKRRKEKIIELTNKYAERRK